MKVSDYIAERCIETGIQDVFLVTGGGAMHLDDSFGHSEKLRCTFHHNEQACAMAAEAYARVDNRPACVLVTTGPGATNALTGVLCAYMESIPMLVLSGQARFATTVRGTGLPLRTSGIQEFDVTLSASPMTKYAVMTEKKEDVRYALEKALYLMMHGRRGPVWLDIPLDVQAAEIDPSALRSFEPAAEGYKDPPAPSAGLVEEIADRLLAAERPVLFGGFGVRASGGIASFRDLSDLLGIPVLTGMSSIDLLPETHPYYAGRTGMTGNRSGNLTMAGSDLFLSIGSRQSFLQTGFNYPEWGREAYTILNELDENELKKPNVRCDLPVICDAKELMDRLISTLKTRGASKEHPYCAKAAGWTARARERLFRFPTLTEAECAPQPDGLSNIYRFYDELSKQLPQGADVIASCGTSRVAGIQMLRLKEGTRFYSNTATASMGYGLPAAIGLARGTGREITAVTGEGSIMMNLQELQTIVTNRIPVRIFLICNGGYHSIRQTQNAYFGKPLIGVGPESGDLDFPEPEKLAACFGLHYGCIPDNPTIEARMREAMALPLPALIEVRVSPLQKTEPKPSSRRLPDGTMVSSPLEDMAPFLSREELAANLEIPLTEGEAMV